MQTGFSDTPNTSIGQFTYKIEAQHDFSLLTVQIPTGRKLMVEASSMAAMDSHIVMKTKMKGGLSRLITRESLFINEFSAPQSPGEILIAPGSPGDIASYTLDGNERLYLTGTSYLASDTGVQINTKWQGFTKGIFSGESFFLIECSGRGQLWFNSYGAIIEKTTDEEWIVDTGHIVAFTSGLDYQLTKFGGYKSLFFSGEGIVAKFKGQGKLWIQSKRPESLVRWASMYRPVK